MLVAATFGIGAGACQGPEPFYRNGDSVGEAGNGSVGMGGVDLSGTAGSNETGGSTGAAGELSGVAGSSSGAAGSTGAAGTTGSAGATGAAGTGAAGTTGAAGKTGAAGAAAGSTGAAGMGRGGGSAAGAGGVAVGKGGTGGRGGSTGAAGAAAGSGGGGGSVIAPPPIQVVSVCQTANAGAITVHFKIYNLSNMAIPFNTITARYFYTLEDTAMTVPIVEFDYLQTLAKTAITVTATATYVEFGFTTGAGTLQAFDNISGTGEIQARIHPPNYSPSQWDTNSTNDPSFMSGTCTTYTPNKGFIGYVGGKQSWPAP